MSGVPGFKSVTDGLSDFNVVSFIFSQLMAGTATAQLVLVQKVTPGEPPTVQVQPMVNQVGADGTAVPHGPLYNIPVMRLQGGKSAIKLDPEAGDIGLAVFAMRDISSVKANLAVSNPGSSRQYDYADGLYIGGFLNSAPTQYIEFMTDSDGNPAGVTIVDPWNTIATSSSGVNVNGLNIDTHGNLTTPGGVQAGTGGADQVSLQTHEHPTAATGAPSPPTPGT